MRHGIFFICGVYLSLAAAAVSSAQPSGFNYDESKVPSYLLPDPLVSLDGSRVTSENAWRRQRRPEILRLFEEQMFGRAPTRPSGLVFEVTSVESEALSGKAVRKEVSVFFRQDRQGPRMDILVYVPADASGAVPLFLA